MDKQHESIDDVNNLLKRSQEPDAATKCNILGVELDIHPNVFSPAFFNDTEFFAENFPDVSNKDLLEIGSGIGAISVLAGLSGASSVTAIDINSDAVKNTNANAEKHDVADIVKAYEGDLFDGLPEMQCFDIIFWNVPFGIEFENEPNILEQSIVDPGYTAIKKFIDNAEQYLKMNGSLLIGFSPTIGNFELLEEFLTDNGYNIAVLAEHELRDPIILFHLYEAKK